MRMASDIGASALGGLRGDLVELGGVRRVLVAHPGAASRKACEGKEGEGREAGHDGEHDGCALASASGCSRRRAGRQRLVGAPFDAALGDDDAGSGGDQESGDLGDQAVAHGEGGEGVGGVRKRHAVADDADRQAADDVDGGNDQACDGVTAYEFRRTVHGAIEAAFLLEFASAAGGPRAR